MNFTIISKEIISNSLSMHEAIDTLSEALKTLDRKKITIPQRNIISLNKNGSIALVSPAYIQDEELGVKIGTIIPENTRYGRNLSQAIYILVNGETGHVQALFDGTELTNLRTGAVSGLATRYLARKNANILAIIGAGIQARYQIRAICTVRSLSEIRIFSRTKASALQLKSELTKDFQGNIYVYDSVDDAILNADIICTATSTENEIPFIYPDQLKLGVYINAIGGRTLQAKEIAPQVLGCSKVYVDSKEAAINESAEIHTAITNNILLHDNIFELCDALLVNDENQKNKQITYFRAVGNAFSDIIIARKIFKMAFLKGFIKKI